ncbi:hypothetical protein [Zavarzinia sp.]|uniref:hypothetical protein n=1 Tax=Zavarzinia sp. TaxID=2027920 RepID=UPI003BB52C46
MTESPRAKTDNMATALDRWTGEGGAPAALAAGAAASGDHHLLLRLGIATLEEWDRLPTDVQRAIFRRAADDRGEAPATMLELARFLHDRATRRTPDTPVTGEANGSAKQA